MTNPAETSWTFPPAFRAAVDNVEHKETRALLRRAMHNKQTMCTRVTQSSGVALLPSEQALDKLRELYIRQENVPGALPWDEAITLVLTNLQPVDYEDFMKDFVV